MNSRISWSLHNAAVSIDSTACAPPTAQVAALRYTVGRLPRAHVGCWNIRIISLATIVGQIEMSYSEPTYAWLITCAACSCSLDASRLPLHAAEGNNRQSERVVAVGE